MGKLYILFNIKVLSKVKFLIKNKFMFSRFWGLLKNISFWLNKNK